MPKVRQAITMPNVSRSIDLDYSLKTYNHRVIARLQIRPVDILPSFQMPPAQLH